MDFKGKVVGSDLENPNNAKVSNSSNELQTPTSTAFSSLSQDSYNRLMEIDNNLISAKSVTTQGTICQLILMFNLVEDLKRKFPSLFAGLTSSQQVTLAKKYLTTSYPSIYAKGSNGTGNKATLNLYSPSENKYVVAATNNTDAIKKIGINLSAYATSFYMDSNGMINMLVNAEPSDGKTASSLSIDYVSLEYNVTIPFPPIN